MRKALILSLAGLFASFWTAGSADAQSDPDLRNIRPVVMMLVDTSGSMERMPDDGLTEGPLPACTGAPGAPTERNRWSFVVEALTGTWNDTDYYCNTRPRSNFAGAPDDTYYLPYHEPPLTVPQQNDGILDVYVDRIKFGLMTFDATYTFTDTHPLLVTQSAFSLRSGDNIGALGGYSYGYNRVLNFPQDGNPTPTGTTPVCGPYVVDSGARNESAASGQLISVGDEAADNDVINALIQTSIRDTRPYGGTPTAALLDDLRYYLNNHPDVTGGDPFEECRPRFGLLITDGRPDDDFRGSRYNCDALPSPYPTSQNSHCPYDRSEVIAGDLCQNTAGRCEGLIDGLFVVALNVDDETIDDLTLISNAGGTGDPLLATDRATLMQQVGTALDLAAPGNTSRSVPTFATSANTFQVGGIASQFQFNAGFHVGVDDQPWYGVLERTRYECNDTSLTPIPEPAATRLRFDQVLNARSDPRALYTVVTADLTDMGGNISGDYASTYTGGSLATSVIEDETLTPFNAAIDPSYFGLTTSTERDAVVAWVHGTTANRVNNRLGDIYHSSPVVIGPPRLDIADEAYNLFRETPSVANRPTVLYVGTNDGILHAFAVEDWQDPVTPTRSLEEGQEIWGFIPPILIDKLNSASTAHQVMLDGTPIVRDVFFERSPGQAPSAVGYRTVLIMGFRGDATGYFALDITNPYDPPVFLWQHVGDGTVGYATGTPALSQLLVAGPQERAVAILPGGEGTLASTASCTPVGTGMTATANTSAVRPLRQCWNTMGRNMTFVDVATGRVLRRVGDTVFTSPISGAVALYPGDVGVVSQRAFFTDADGVLWSADLTLPDQTAWTFRAVHDLYWDGAYDDGQPAYGPPLVSADDNGQLVVIQGTGDIDRLDSPAANRIASITESVSYNTSGVPSYASSLNWEIRLLAGEQVTGPLELFEGRVYFATFESGSALADACYIGQSRIWGVHYIEHGATPPASHLAEQSLGSFFPNPQFETTAGTGVFDAHYQGPISDRLVLGVGVTQRPTCVQGSTVSDTYLGNRYRVDQTGGGQFVLTAMVSGGTAEAAGGGAFELVSQTLPTPPSTTMIHHFAGEVDY